MPPFRPNARHLYLFALFHLVGGAMVILTVVLFSRLEVGHSAEDGLKANVPQGLNRPGWQKVLLADNGEAGEHEKTGKQDEVLLERDSTGILEGMAWEQLNLSLGDSGSEAAPGKRLKSFVSAWPQVPPIPPPRLA